MSPILGSRGISPRGYGFAGAGKPNAPVSVVATDVGTSRAFNNGAASVAFSSGGDNGAPITSFVVTSNPSGFTATGASSPLVVTGLASSTSYTFTVTATNSVGTSDASSASSSITATTVPQAPTIGTVTITNATTVSVPFTAGATGGSTITSYTATSSPSISLSVSGTTTPLTITGTFVSQTAYTIQIAAVNTKGTSISSSASNSITPNAPVVATGGTITTGGGFRYHTFNSSGTFAVTSKPATINNLALLTVSGGSSGQNVNPGIGFGGNGGSGGSGATAASVAFNATNYSVVVGGVSSVSTFAGGTNSSAATAGNGAGGGSGAGNSAATGGGAGWLTSFNALLGSTRYGGGGGGGGGINSGAGAGGGAGGGGGGGNVGNDGGGGSSGLGGGGGGGGSDNTGFYGGQGGAGGGGTVIIKYAHS